jgi:hypothetical protein
LPDKRAPWLKVCALAWPGAPSIDGAQAFGEGETEPRYFFAAAYAACAALAFVASRKQPHSAAERTGPFWLRIAILCAVFAVLRSFDANIAVSSAVRDLQHSAHLTGWERPGQYLMLAALIVFGAAVAGLLLFRGRTLHGSVRGAAIAIIGIVLLAIAQSVSLYVSYLLLDATIGPVTLSRIIEGILLLSLAFCELWFIRDSGERKGAR